MKKRHRINLKNTKQVNVASNTRDILLNSKFERHFNVYYVTRVKRNINIFTFIEKAKRADKKRNFIDAISMKRRLTVGKTKGKINAK